MNIAQPVAAGRLGILSAAPHRLLFFIGASNVLLAMVWWAAWLVAARWQPFAMPQPQVPAGWLHAFVMQYQMLPSFIFGFLFTVFPRWMGQPELERWRYAPIGLGLFGGQVATLLGALGWAPGITIGALLTVGGWLGGIAQLLPLLWREQGTTWHARSCMLALLFGMIGLLLWLVFLLDSNAMAAFASIKIGTFALLLPVYLAVAHRMFPFFAGNAVPGYQPWRPMWLLAASWPLLIAHLSLELFHAYAWLWLVDVPLLALALLMNWKLWPRRRMPGLLAALFVGLAWLPLTFALYAAQSAAYAMTGVFWLGRAPAHALFIGFFGSVLVAMVTRVTQGHSGRALTMPKAAWWAFAAVQVVALARIAAEFAGDPGAWMAWAAIGWLLAFVPWVARIGRIYLSPRADGKPG